APGPPPVRATDCRPAMLHNRSMRAGLVLAVALAACRDSTAPDRSFSVTAAIDVQPEGVFSDTPNGPLISCALPVTLTAHGTGTGTWTGATELWFVGPDQRARSTRRPTRRATCSRHS